MTDLETEPTMEGTLSRLSNSVPPRPTIAIIVPTYNSAGTFESLAASIDKQTHPASEVIVVDNFSSDGTPEAALAHGYRVICRRAPRAVARRLGASSASSSHVLFVDSDQVLDSECIGVLTGFLSHMPHSMATLYEQAQGTGHWADMLRLDDRVGFEMGIGIPRCFPRAAYLSVWQTEFERHDHVHGEDRILAGELRERGLHLESLGNAKVLHQDPELGDFLLKQFTNTYRGTQGDSVRLYATSVSQPLRLLSRPRSVYRACGSTKALVAYLLFLTLRVTLMAAGSASARVRRPATRASQ